MATQSDIEWTEMTWNPVTGCTMISPGCAHCYAERMAKRLQAMGQPSYRNGFRLTLQPQTLEIPLRWKKPRTIFVNSMSDLFHQDVPLDYIRQVFDVMNRANWHTYQILTKRSERLFECAPDLAWQPHIWMGVSVENQKCANRIEHLRQTAAHVKFISIEPLLGPLPALDLTGIHWVIVGGESGPGARPMDPAWVKGIRDQCTRANVAFFFKQWGGVNKKKTGRELDGMTWNEMPSRPQLRVLATA
ncbi:MAG TPA: phage Gp37/Gp68 family protein [Tepidisphaeraceae bacterium]|nr:phage Gp37/Gp68 family protein [Tepidisphaeraceae bacterium]